LVILVLIFIQSNGLGQDHYISDKIEYNNNLLSFFSSIYNYNFADAKTKADNYSSINLVEKDLINANYYWWLIISGENSEQNQAKCNTYLNNVLDKLSLIKTTNLTENEVFSYIYIYSYKARLEIFNNKNIKALMHLYNAIDYIQIALDNYSKNDRYKLIAGLYNYFVAYVIEKYPIFYPYFFLMPKGDKMLGIKLLEQCSGSSDILVKTESLYFLMKINLEFENNYSLANNYCAKLTNLYHNNLIYNYYYFKSFIQLNEKENALGQFVSLQEIASVNNQLSKNQKKHLVEVAKFDLKKHGY